MKSTTKTLTEGPLAKQILLVSLPLALSNLLQILFNMSDVAVVGRFAGSTALGSVGSTATFVTLFTGFLIGLSNGVNVLVARFYGAGHPKDVSKTVHSALLVSLAADKEFSAKRTWRTLKKWALAVVNFFKKLFTGKKRSAAGAGEEESGK